MYSFPNLEPVRCSMSVSNCCFLTCIQISQEAGKVVWYSHLFKNFPQFVVIQTVKGFRLVNEAELDIFLELPCFLNDPMNVDNSISSFSLLFLLFSHSVVSLCDPMDCSTPGFPVLHHLPGLAQTHVHWISDAIQPSHPLTSPSPPAFNLSQHQGLFQCQLFTSGGQIIGASASTSVLPMNIQGWFPLGLIGLTSLLSRGLSRVLSKPQFEGITSLALSLFYCPLAPL